MLNLDDLMEKKGTEKARLVCEVSQQSFNHVTYKDLPLPPSRIIIIIIITTTIIIISNGKRTEWIPIRSVIIRVINKMRESDLFNHEYDHRPNSTTRSSVTN